MVNLDSEILSLFDNGSFILFKWKNGENWPVDYVSKNLTNITGYSISDFLSGKITYASIIHTDDINRVFEEVEKNSKNLKTASFTHKPYRIRTLDGEYLWVQDTTSIVRDANNNISYYVGHITDITATKEALERAEHFATHDYLTSLPNLILFQDRVEQAIIESLRDKKKFAILSLDIDNFRAINDTLSHDVGNKILVRLARDIANVIRKKDTISRHGGDNFLILLKDIKDKEAVKTVIKKLFVLNQTPYIINEHEIHFTYSIGAVLYPKHGEVFQTLLKHVDNALYASKKNHTNSYQFFSKNIYESMKQKQKLYTKLNTALKYDEIKILFQPKVDVQTKRVTGAEALVRWINRDEGFIPPDIFIPIAEESGLIIELGRYIFKKACEALKIILERDPHFIMAINISTVEFQREGFVDQCQKIVKQLNLKASSIELELTESLMLNSTKESIKKLHYLRDLGFKIALDDFGTGYSSLSYLKDFPINTIKIDISFIRAMMHDKSTLSLVKIIIGFNKIFQVKIVAEGVENKEEYQVLKDEKCDTIQGYLFSKPLPFEQFLHYIENSKKQQEC